MTMSSSLLNTFPTPTIRQRDRDLSLFPIRTAISRSKTPSAFLKRSEMPATIRQASLKLDFIVIGAGVGGLAAAFALSRSGHRVRVFDKLDGSSRQRSVGARIPPNLSKILYAWGLRDELSSSTKCLKTQFHTMEKNELVGILEWQEDVIKETGGDFLLMHYGDFYTMLYNLVVSAGITITFNTEIVSVSVDLDGAPKALLSDGTILTADLIIGADGSQSVVREAVTGLVESDLPCDHSFITVVVPVEMLKKDPDWAKWVGVQEWPIWMGSGRSLLAYPIKGGREYCVHAYWPHSHIQGDVPESWETYIPTSAIDFEGSHPSIQRLFSMVPQALRSKYVVREPLEDWVDPSGTLILIGEAAHPLMPFTIHNASLTVEDAAVLGSLMSHLSSREQLPQIFEAYQDLRHLRVKHVQESELNNAALVTQADPQIRAMRDAALGQSLKLQNNPIDNWSDEQLRAQWEEIGAVFGYDAADAAEDWWLKWGALGEQSRQDVSRPLFNFSFHITQTVA